MKRKTKAEQITAARIQGAVYGFRIPMLSIPKLYTELDTAVAAGGSDTELKRLVAKFPGVEVAS